MPGHDVVVIGSYVQDHIWTLPAFPRPGETAPADGYASCAGGKGFNQAVAARRLGADALFVGALGDDAGAEGARAFAAAEGLAASWQVVAGEPTAAAGILVDGAGNNLIAVALGANRKLAPSFIAGLAGGLAGSRLLLTQMETSLAAVAAVADLADALAIPAILNPAPMDGALPPALLRRFPLVTPNETEFAQLLACCGVARVDPDQVAALPDDELQRLARGLGVATVVVTLGRHGCFVCHAGGSPWAAGEPACYRLAAEAVASIDSTGAGDCFNGALAAALAAGPGAGFRTAIVDANRAAALSTERRGTTVAMPTRAEVVARFGA